MEVMIVKEETLVAGGMKEEDTYLMKTAKVKMDHVREENERLKLTLSRMMKNYHSLKMQFNDIVKEDDCDQPKIKSSTDDIEESDPFVSLSLGRFSGDHSSKRDEKIKADYSNESKTHENDRKLDGLELGLDCKFHAAGNPAHDHHQVSRNLMGSPENNYSSDESKEEGNDEKRGSRKSPKISRSGDDEVLQLQNPLKKPRVSVRAVCNTQTMHDGCQWRKYGQKISKGNPCPRAYYRCTVSPSCPVRKQVQRCMDDMTILITTYEGAHNHPLPPAATTMASATTAAASMLNFGSTTSPPGSGVSATCSSTTSRGFNFASSNNMFPRATISTSQSHPTVILDLTPPNHSNNNSNASAQNNKLFSSSTLFSTPTNSLNFSSSSNWNTNFSNFKNSQPFNYNNLSQQEIIANEYDHKFSAATKAITRDPSFQSALAAAITSFVGNNVQGRNSNSGLNFDLSFTQPSTSNGSIACATSLLNKFPQISVDYQHKDMAHFAPLTLMSSSKSKAMVSMADEAEQIKLL